VWNIYFKYQNMFCLDLGCLLTAFPTVYNILYPVKITKLVFSISRFVLPPRSISWSLIKP